MLLQLLEYDSLLAGRQFIVAAELGCGLCDVVLQVDLDCTRREEAVIDHGENDLEQALLTVPVSFNKVNLLLHCLVRFGQLSKPVLNNHLAHGRIDSLCIHRKSVRPELHLLFQCECRGTRVSPPVQINAMLGAAWVTLTGAGVFLGLA